MLQFQIQRPGVSYKSVECFPKVLAVISYVGVNQLMQNDIIEDLFGQHNELDGQTDIILVRTASPSALQASNGNFIIGKAMPFCQFI